MTNRPHKSQTDKFLFKVQQIKEARHTGVDSPDEYSRKLNKFLNELQKAVKEGHNISDIPKQNNRESLPSWVGSLKSVQSSYNNLYAQHMQCVNEEDAIHRIEFRAHLRTLIYRFLTTLGIGLGILLVYGLAQHFEIALPLGHSFK